MSRRETGYHKSSTVQLHVCESIPLSTKYSFRCALHASSHTHLTSIWVMIIRDLIRKPAEHLQEMQNSCQSKAVSSKTSQQIPGFKNAGRRKSVSGALTAALQQLSLRESLPICASESPAATKHSCVEKLCTSRIYMLGNVRGRQENSLILPSKAEPSHNKEQKQKHH